MLSLKDIDYAFICMNIPYTMTVEQAASAVLKFHPKPEAYQAFPTPQLILITHAHGDHFDAELIKKLKLEHTGKNESQVIIWNELLQAINKAVQPER